MRRLIKPVPRAPVSDRIYNVLFLCTGNSARSILGEVLMNHWGKGRFRGFSAGSQPKGELHPMALALLEHLDLPTDGLHSKNWEAFASDGAPSMDFVFTVCDSAAEETCPVWPGQPMTAHWGIPDPAAVTGDEKTRMQAFRGAFLQLEKRVRIFSSLPIASLDELQIQTGIDRIGEVED
jgi:arsenate reductase